MPVVNGVPQLKREHGVGVSAVELGTELVGRQAVAVEAVVPLDPLQNLDIPSREPVTRLHHHLCGKASENGLKRTVGRIPVGHSGWNVERNDGFRSKSAEVGIMYYTVRSVGSAHGYGNGSSRAKIRFKIK